MAALVFLVTFFVLVVVLFIVAAILERKWWQVRYYQGEHNGPTLPFADRRVSKPMSWWTANTYAEIFGGTVERVPRAR